MLSGSNRYRFFAVSVKLCGSLLPLSTRPVFSVSVMVFCVSTGASLTGVTSMLAVRDAVLNAVAPPTEATLAVDPSTPALRSQAR